MPRIIYETEVLRTDWMKADEVEIKLDHIDNSLVIKLDGKTVWTLGHYNHLKIIGLTEDGDKIG